MMQFIEGTAGLPEGETRVEGLDYVRLYTTNIYNIYNVLGNSWLNAVLSSIHNFCCCSSRAQLPICGIVLHCGNCGTGDGIQQQPKSRST
jgi:hypothetical protein